MDAKQITLIGVVLEVIPLWVLCRGKPFLGKSRLRSSSYWRSQAAGAFLIVSTLPLCLLAVSLTDQGCGSRVRARGTLPGCGFCNFVREWGSAST